MYKVLLVDDEPWILVGIRNTFKWEEMGFMITNETCRAEEAYKLICLEKPDVVFTDIKMPKMSGIELMKKVRKQGLNTEFIVISGFAEFSYAQEALRQGAFDYCLKPIEEVEADKILKRISEYLKAKEIQQEKNIKNKKGDNSNISIDWNIYNPQFEKLINYLYANSYRSMTLKELSDRFYLNPNYSCMLFKRNFGKTFSNCLTAIRMEKASELIRDVTLTIKEISSLSGYKDYYYFNKVFKKYYGMTPILYRKELCNDKT